MNAPSLNRLTQIGASDERVHRPETVIETRFSHLGGAVNDLDQIVGDAISKFSPVIVPYPLNAMKDIDSAKLPPKPVQSDFVNRLETLTDHVNGIAARLREALANAQI